MLNPGTTFTSNPSLQALNYTTPSTQPDLQFCLAKICFYSKYCPSANIAVEDGQSQTDTLRHFKFQTFHPAWLDSTGSEQLHGNCMECPSALSECQEPSLTHQMSISVIFMIFVTNCSTWFKLQWAMGKVETLMIHRSCKINPYNVQIHTKSGCSPQACHTGSFCKGYKDKSLPSLHSPVLMQLPPNHHRHPSCVLGLSGGQVQCTSEMMTTTCQTHGETTFYDWVWPMSFDLHS